MRVLLNDGRILDANYYKDLPQNPPNLKQWDAMDVFVNLCELNEFLGWQNDEIIHYHLSPDEYEIIEE